MVRGGSIVGIMPTQPDSAGASGGFEVRKKVDPKGAPTAPDLHLTTGNLLVLKKEARLVQSLGPMWCKPCGPPY